MLATFFEDIADFRRPQGQKYKLSSLLVFSILAILANAKSYRDIHRFISAHFAELKSDFNLGWKSAPAYTTIRNAIIGVDAVELEAAFRAFTQSLLQYWLNDDAQSPPSYIVIGLDGKTLRGSYDRFKDQPALHKLFFYDPERKLILGHMDTEGKASEMETAQTLLAEVSLPGALFTMDALHCQKKPLPVLPHPVTDYWLGPRTISSSCVRI